MEKLNKKGIGIKIIFYVVIFLLVSMIGTIGFYQLGDEFVIDNIYNITTDAANETGVSNITQQTMQEAKNNYDGLVIHFDLIFALIFLGAFAGSIFLDSKSEPLPTFSFLGYATMGLMFLLLILVFLDQFVNWFINDFFYVLFDNANQDTPFLDWYFNNLSLISIIWFAILLFINQVDINIKTILKKEEIEGEEGSIEE